ncbi:hypothetical protein EYF80_034244 [Liparis tanakae]|uniref:Uncharacterized protein n=1 Tax=Liparis tanakae TaxID=230148 RepID=A0A4Z2GS15_9TELE|nr:hypothetical protein EYF80_034244 [Liparis tanakae]
MPTKELCTLTCCDRELKLLRRLWWLWALWALCTLCADCSLWTLRRSKSSAYGSARRRVALPTGEREQRMAVVPRTWRRACQSTDWFWSWVAPAEAPCTGGLGLEVEVGIGQVESGIGQVEVGIGQGDTALGHLGILHNYHNSPHTSARALQAGARSLAGCLQRKVVGVVLQELAQELLEVARRSVGTPFRHHLGPIHFGGPHPDSSVSAHGFKGAVGAGLKDARRLRGAGCGGPQLLQGAPRHAHIYSRGRVDLLEVASGGRRQARLVAEARAFLLDEGTDDPLLPPSAAAAPVAHVAVVGGHAGRSDWSLNRIGSLQVGPGFKLVHSLSRRGSRAAVEIVGQHFLVQDALQILLVVVLGIASLVGTRLWGVVAIIHIR